MKDSLKIEIVSSAALLRSLPALCQSIGQWTSSCKNILNDSIRACRCSPSTFFTVAEWHRCHGGFGQGKKMKIPSRVGHDRNLAPSWRSSGPCDAPSSAVKSPLGTCTQHSTVRFGQCRQYHPLHVAMGLFFSWRRASGPCDLLEKVSSRMITAGRRRDEGGTWRFGNAWSGRRGRRRRVAATS